MNEPNFESEEWYSELVEELKGLKENFLDNRNEITMQMKWLMGQSIKLQKEPYGMNQKLAQDLGISPRSVGYAVEFYNDFPSESWDKAYGEINSKLSTEGHRVSWSGWLKFKKLGSLNDCVHDYQEQVRYRCSKCGKIVRNLIKPLDK